jgi:hypothetical protein
VARMAHRWLSGWLGFLTGPRLFLTSGRRRRGINPSPPRIQRGTPRRRGRCLPRREGAAPHGGAGASCRGRDPPRRARWPSAQAACGQAAPDGARARAALGGERPQAMSAVPGGASAGQARLGWSGHGGAGRDPLATPTRAATVARVGTGAAPAARPGRCCPARARGPPCGLSAARRTPAAPAARRGRGPGPGPWGGTAMAAPTAMGGRGCSGHSERGSGAWAAASTCGHGGPTTAARARSPARTSAGSASRQTTGVRPSANAASGQSAARRPTAPYGGNARVGTRKTRSLLFVHEDDAIEYEQKFKNNILQENPLLHAVAIQVYVHPNKKLSPSLFL